MDWGNPEKVFGGGLDPVVLHVLWRAGVPMTGEQVARVATTGSVRGIRYALGRLAGFGIVSASNVGSAILYELNSEHLTYPAVDAAFRSLDPWSLLRDRVRRLVAKHTDDDVTVALFGSVARGDSRDDSDVDVLVVVRTDGDEADDLRTALSDNVRMWTGQSVGVYLTTAERLRAAERAGDPIVGSFVSDAVTLVGPDVPHYVNGAT